MSKEIEKLKKAMIKKRPSSSAIPSKDYLSTGSMHLNLCCSGRASGGLAKGRCYLYAGDSSSGKTWLGMSALAEASINPEFDEYKLILDAAENGSSMNIERFFGKRLAERIEPPFGTKDEPEYSSVLEDYYDNLTRLMEEGPCIYLLDSMDALRPSAQIKHEKEAAKARNKNKEASGSFHTDKPKINSARLREVNTLLAKTKSILIMIAQSRQALGFAARFNPKTFSGGDALRFYPRLILWTSIKGRETKEIRGQSTVLGQTTQVKIVKNHLSGWEGKLELPFLKGIGIDDIGSAVQFLVNAKHWSEVKGVVTAKEFNQKLQKEKLIRYIEEADLEPRLRKIVAQVWYEIEDQSTIKRKKKYD